MPERNTSVNNFLQLIEHDISSGAEVSSDNFFLNRYTYLGLTYEDILKNALSNPVLIFRHWGEKDKVENLNYMFAPFAYIALFAPFWLIAIPDYLIALMADVKGFLSIENQRVSMMVASLFVTYAIFISFANNYQFVRKFKLLYIFSFCCLVLTIHTSIKSENPLFTNGLSLVQNKIVKKVFSQTEQPKKGDSYGEVRKGQVSENSIDCREKVLDIINEINPRYYSGPDALGAHTANRRMNALFPAGIERTEMFVSDIFDLKAYGSLEDFGQYRANQLAVIKMLTIGGFKHIYSCDRMSIFAKGDESDNNLEFNMNNTSVSANLQSKSGEVTVTFGTPSPESNIVSYTIEGLSSSIEPGVVTYWEFVDESDESVLTFLDYKFWTNTNSINKTEEGTTMNLATDLSFLKSELPKGRYKVYYGFGSTSKAQEAYFFDMIID